MIPSPKLNTRIEFQISWNSVGCQVETRLIAEIRRQFFLAQYVAIAILLDFIVIWWEDADFSEFHESRRNFFTYFGSNLTSFSF